MMTIHEIYIAWMNVLRNGTVEGHWLVFLLVMLAVAEGLFVIITKSEKRYKESLVSYTVKFKFLSIFLSVFVLFGALFGAWAVVGVVLLILDNFMQIVMVLGIILIVTATVIGWILINYWIAKANVKEQKFKKGEK